MPLEQKKLAAAGLATREERVAAFKAFDLDGSGSVSIDEVMRIMCRETEFGAQFSIAEAKEHIDEFDSNSDGRWSLDEFLTFCEGSNDHGHGHDTMVQKALTGKAAKMAMLGLADREDIVAAFEAFDKDRDGRVSVAEIITVMCRETVGKGAQFTKDEAQEHLDEFDLDGNGTWSLDEFVDFCQGTNDHGHGHDTMVKESLVGESAIASYNFGVLRAALGVFDTAAKGRLPEKEVVSILTRDCGRGSASSDTTISLEDAQKIAELCAEKDIATGERMPEREAVGSMAGAVQHDERVIFVGAIRVEDDAFAVRQPPRHVIRLQLDASDQDGKRRISQLIHRLAIKSEALIKPAGSDILGQ